MRYYKIIEDSYLTAIGKGPGGVEITAEEYEDILSVIRGKPTAEEGFGYRLKEGLTWELVEVPTEETDE